MCCRPLFSENLNFHLKIEKKFSISSDLVKSLVTIFETVMAYILNLIRFPGAQIHTQHLTVLFLMFSPAGSFVLCQFSMHFQFCILGVKVKLSSTAFGY